MSDPAPSTPPASATEALAVTPPVEAPAPTAALAKAKSMDPAKAFAALGNPMRWHIFQMLVGGKAMSASQVAAVLKRDFDGVSKHLRLMRAAGVLASKRGEDRRLELYHIPPELLRADGVVDLGFCAIRLYESKV